MLSSNKFVGPPWFWPSYRVAIYYQLPAVPTPFCIPLQKVNLSPVFSHSLISNFSPSLLYLSFLLKERRVSWGIYLRTFVVWLVACAVPSASYILKVVMVHITLTSFSLSVTSPHLLGRNLSLLIPNHGWGISYLTLLAVWLHTQLLYPRGKE